MVKQSALPEDTAPTMDDYVTGYDATGPVAKRNKWSRILAMLLTGIYPVGSVIINTTGQNPADAMGFGTWQAFGAGRTLVGLDASQAEFNTPEEIGGAKTHTLTENEMPSHFHSGNTTTNGNHSHTIGREFGSNDSLVAPGQFAQMSQTSGWFSGWMQPAGDHFHFIDTNSKGGNAPHNNLQPYVVVYFWKRTA